MCLWLEWHRTRAGPSLGLVSDSTQFQFVRFLGMGHWMKVVSAQLLCCEVFVVNKCVGRVGGGAFKTRYLFLSGPLSLQVYFYQSRLRVSHFIQLVVIFYYLFWCSCGPVFGHWKPLKGGPVSWLGESPPLACSPCSLVQLCTPLRGALSLL